MAAKKALAPPSIVHVYREKDGDTSYLVAWDTISDAAEYAEEGTLIGTYSLNHAGKYAVNKTVTEV